MLHKTRGVVLHNIKYSETSVVAYIYTELFGRQTYLINGIRSRKSKGKMAMLSPLSLLDMQVYYRPNKQMQRIAEMSPKPHLVSIPFDPVKGSIAMFLSEILYKSLKQEESDPAMFQFLHHAIAYFDLAENSTQKANFHLIFLFYLSRHLGFFPESNYSSTHELFDLLNGSFVIVPPIHNAYLSVADSRLLQLLFDTTSDFTFKTQHTISQNKRTRLLNLLLRYYAHHIEGIDNIKSLDVLKEVFAS